MSMGGITVTAQRLEPSLTELCHSSWSCQLAGLLSELWLLVFAGVFALIVLAALSTLRAAADAVEEEQSRTTAERDAFRSFAQRVAELSPDTATSAGVATTGAVATAAVAEPARGLAKVREAYRETVMAVPHYDEDYGETLVENMAAEFGDDAAMPVQDTRSLSPMLKQLLVSKATAAATERERLIGRLSHEADELKSARETLSEVEAELEDYDLPTLNRVDYGGLVDRWDHLDELEDRCSEVLQTRQHNLGERNGGQRTDAATFIEYVYSLLPVDYPVLAESAAVLERIEDARRTVTLAAVRRA